MEKYSGVLHAWAETGTEGFLWALFEDGKGGYDAMRFIDGGDHLTVFGENGEIIFDGEIIEDYQAGWQEYPLNPGHGRPSALGYWIHWTQQGWEPDKWAALFLHELLKGGNGKPLRAELIKKQNSSD